MTGLPSSIFYCLWNFAAICGEVAASPCVENLAENFGEVPGWRHRCVFRPNTVF